MLKAPKEEIDPVAARHLVIDIQNDFIADDAVPGKKHFHVRIVQQRVPWKALEF
jgi:hypothetical protein